MVSDSELISRLREFLRNSDLNTTTTAIVRRKLEEEFNVDLLDKKLFIREQVDLFLRTEHEAAEEDAAEEDGDGTLKTEEQDGDSEDGENEEEEEEDDEKGKTSSNKHSKEVKKRGGGFSKLCSLSPQLQEFTGVPEMARTEVVKQLWNHIRENNLQDPSNRRNIICDESLKALFGVNSINMFQMNKALSKHIWPLDSNDVIPAKSSQKEQEKEKPEKKRKKQGKEEKPKKKRQKQQKEEDSDESAREEKQQKKGKSGFLAPLQLSDALVSFFGTGEDALSRSEVVKRMWGYIKENNLQDPSDKRTVICDDKLKELFDVDTFHGFTVSKLLAPHLSKTK